MALVGVTGGLTPCRVSLLIWASLTIPGSRLGSFGSRDTPPESLMPFGCKPPDSNVFWLLETVVLPPAGAAGEDEVVLACRQQDTSHTSILWGKRHAAGQAIGPSHQLVASDDTRRCIPIRQY